MSTIKICSPSKFTPLSNRYTHRRDVIITCMQMTSCSRPTHVCKIDNKIILLFSYEFYKTLTERPTPALDGTKCDERCRRRHYRHDKSASAAFMANTRPGRVRTGPDASAFRYVRGPDDRLPYTRMQRTRVRRLAGRRTPVDSVLARYERRGN